MIRHRRVRRPDGSHALALLFRVRGRTIDTHLWVIEDAGDERGLVVSFKALVYACERHPHGGCAGGGGRVDATVRYRDLDRDRVADELVLTTTNPALAARHVSRHRRDDRGNFELPMPFRPALVELDGL